MEYGKRFKLMRDLPDLKAGAILTLASDDDERKYLYFNAPNRKRAYKLYLDELQCINFFYWFEPVRELVKVV